MKVQGENFLSKIVEDKGPSEQIINQNNPVPLIIYITTDNKNGIHYTLHKIYNYLEKKRKS